MNTDLLSGKVAGVPLLVSRSWVPALAATAVACAVAVRTLVSGLSLVAAATLGLVLALALTLSLIIHELAHALVARSAGIEIDHIRLFAGGALCRRKHVMGAPREQFVVAAAGPLASTALGVAALSVAAGAGALGLGPAVTTALWFLAFVNILIAVTNLLPIFPFDGGKLVHSLFWRAGRDHRAASDRLDRGGREFARLIMTLGVLLMAVGDELLVGFVVLLFGLYLLRLPSPP